MRVAEYMGVLYQSGLVKFASKEEMQVTDNPIIRQFLAGKAAGPIGMDEMAEVASDIELELERSALQRHGEAEQGEIMKV
jgi:phospholipid/cholesterol/gamma-HCH transport system ATP-binding protein